MTLLDLDFEIKLVECEYCGLFIMFPMWIINKETKKKMTVCQHCVHKIRIKNLDMEE